MDDANRQAGVFTRQQAYAAGVSRSRLAAQLHAGRWQHVLPRVYAAYSGPLSRRSQLWAVVLWAGAGAALSHDTAGELAGLVDLPASAVHVTVPSTRRLTAVPGVLVHLSRRCHAATHPTFEPPQTRIEETVLDLIQRATAAEDAVGWLTRACARRLTTPSRLADALAQRAKVRWRLELDAALADVGSGCHSPLELRYLRDVERRHRIPTGVRQAPRTRPGGRWYDDVSYEHYRVRVELDGQSAHPHDMRWRDMRRDNAATVAGASVLRFGWTDVTRRPCAVAAQVAVVLRHNGWRGRPRPCGPGCSVITKLLTRDSEPAAS